MNPRNSTMFHRDTSHAVDGMLMQTYGMVSSKLLNAGIDITREMRTVDGDLVRIIALDVDHKFSIVGEIIDEAARVCWLARWNLNGTYCGTIEAIEKHSIAKNSATVGKTGARLPKGSKYFVIDEDIPGGIVDEAVKRQVSAARERSDTLARGVLGEPVHDMGLEEKADESRTFAQAFEEATEPAAPTGAVHSILDEALLDRAQSTLSFDHNRAAPEVLPGPFSVRHLREYVAERYSGYDAVTRAFATCAINSRCGRFRWYSLSPVDTPPDSEIVEAARILNETDTPFHAITSPVLARLYQIGAIADGELLKRLRHVDQIQRGLRARR